MHRQRVASPARVGSRKTGHPHYVFPDSSTGCLRRRCSSRPKLPESRAFHEPIQVFQRKDLSPRGQQRLLHILEARDSLGALGFAVSDAGRGEDLLDLDFQAGTDQFRDGIFVAGKWPTEDQIQKRRSCVTLAPAALAAVERGS